MIEYALLTGIIAIAGILVFPTIQAKMADAYQAWNENAQGHVAAATAPLGAGRGEAACRSADAGR